MLDTSTDSLHHLSSYILNKRIIKLPGFRSTALLYSLVFVYLVFSRLGPFVSRIGAAVSVEERFDDKYFEGAYNSLQYLIRAPAPINTYTVR